MSFIIDKIWRMAIILAIFFNNYFKDNKIVKTLKSIEPLISIEEQNISQTERWNFQAGNKEKYIYFMILRPSDEKVNLDLTFSSDIELFRFNKRTI